MDVDIIWGIVWNILLAMIGAFIIFLIVSIILFIFQAVGLYKIAKREGHEDKAWLSFIPIVHSFLLTTLLERAVHKELRGRLTIGYGIVIAVAIVLGPELWLAFILPVIFYYYVFYFLAKRYSTNPALHLVLAIITFGLSTYIQIFMFRNRQVVDSTGLEFIDTE